ncbi:MAG: outer membrane lipid asymmetry maintenance protein MlaD [Alphaproteobacteria bacterium]|nr:outer membrane lipid asymmetry maintenance protein MlaD [Alphaproteobacteria bacterium]
MSGARGAGAQGVETMLGFAVLAVAGTFLAYALDVGGMRHVSGGYVLTAKFGQAGALAPGANVSIAGVKVGTVAQISLDPSSYQAVAKLTLDPKVKVPADSTAKITSDGLLGGAHVAIEPGSAAEMLAANGEFENTQGAVDLLGLIGQVMRPQPAAVAAPSPTGRF